MLRYFISIIIRFNSLSYAVWFQCCIRPVV